MPVSMTQKELFIAFSNPGQPCPANLKTGKHLPATSGLNIYRNTIARGLIATLESNFPKTRAVLGPKNFYSLARLYASKEKPTSSLLYKYGVGFSKFLQKIPALSELGYLPDLARLEQHIRLSYHARDCALYNWENLLKHQDTDLLTACCQFDAACFIIPTYWPLGTIYRKAQSGAPTRHPKRLSSASAILVTRPEFDPQITTVPEELIKFLDALAAGHTFQTACNIGKTSGPAFTLKAGLQFLVNANSVHDITF